MALSGLGGSPGFGAKRNSTLFEAVRARFVECATSSMANSASLETEIAQVRGDACGELGRGCLALGTDLRAEFEQRFARAAVDLVCPAASSSSPRDSIFAKRSRRLLTEFDHVRDRPPYLRFKVSNSETRSSSSASSRGIEIEFLRVALQSEREIFEFRDARDASESRKPRRSRINAFQFAQQLCRSRRARRSPHLRFGEPVRGSAWTAPAAAGCWPPRCIAGSSFFLFTRHATARRRSRGPDAAADRVPAPARIHSMRGPRVRRRVVAAARNCASYFAAQLLRAGEGVEQRELFFRGEQRLMIVRAVQIDEFVAELFQHGECRRRCR